MGLQAKVSITYGSRWLRGKVAVLFCLLALPVWAAEEITILALGDSLTHGYGLPADDGFVPQLEDWLNAQDHAVQIINGGVSGDTSAGAAARVDWNLTPEVDAMIVTIGANDFLRGIAPEVTRKNVEMILKVAQAHELPVLLVGMRAPGNFGPDYKARFDAIYPELAAAYRALHFDGFFSGLGQGEPGDLQRYFQPDGLHPNAEGVSRIVTAIGPAVIDLITRAEN